MVTMPGHERTDRPRAALLLIGVMLLASACEIDRPDGFGSDNTRPSVSITGGAVDGQTVDYRVEFFWFGSDPDGLVDHFLYAIDDTCLCRYEVTTTIPTPQGPVTVTDVVESVDPDSCRAHGETPVFESADALWSRTDEFSGAYVFSAEEPVDSLETPTATQFHTFHIKSVDNEGARSIAASRFFNARTIAPSVRLTVPLGSGYSNYATVGSFVTPRWKGHDVDSTDPQELPRGYQMKLVKLDSVFDPNSLPIRYLTDESLLRRNFLIHDSLVVGTTDSVTTETYLATDWWPKRNEPYSGARLPLDDLEGGAWAFAVRAIDDAGALTPDRAFRLADQFNEGNVVKMDVNPNLPGGPAIHVAEQGLGSKTFRGLNEVWHVEVPVNVPVEFFWEVDASHYGADPGPSDYALDIPDPGCNVCTDPQGIGGWIGWANRDRLAFPITFTNEQAGEQHVLYIRARDSSFSEERETLAVIVIDPIGFSFEKTALWVDDFKWAGVNDCWHDSTLAVILEAAVEPYLVADEELDRWNTYQPPWQTTVVCQEVDEPALIPLSRIGRYRLIYWNVSATLGGSGLGNLSNPAEDSETGVGKHLQNYVAAGGRLIIWGRRLYGGLLGDLYPQDTPWLPDIPANPEPNFGPGSFVWDVLRLRTRLDWVGRGTSQRLSTKCSGLIGLEATQTAADLGFPIGDPDPTGYDPSRTAIWIDTYEGAENPIGSRGAVGMMGLPPVRVTGLDTLYTFVSNSWTYEQGGPFSVREACGSGFLSPFEGHPVVFRLDGSASIGGRVAVIGAPFVFFFERSPHYITEIMSKLTSWALE